MRIVLEDALVLSPCFIGEAEAWRSSVLFQLRQLYPQGFGRSRSTRRAAGRLVQEKVNLWSCILIGMNWFLSLWPLRQHSHHQPFIMSCLLCVSLNALYRPQRSYFSSFLDIDNVLFRPHLVFRVSGACWSWLREKETSIQTEIVTDLASDLSLLSPKCLSLFLPYSSQLELYTNPWNSYGNKWNLWNKVHTLKSRHNIRISSTITVLNQRALKKHLCTTNYNIAIKSFL